MAASLSSASRARLDKTRFAQTITNTESASTVLAGLRLLLHPQCTPWASDTSLVQYGAILHENPLGGYTFHCRPSRALPPTHVGGSASECLRLPSCQVARPVKSSSTAAVKPPCKSPGWPFSSWFRAASASCPFVSRHSQLEMRHNARKHDMADFRLPCCSC